MNTEFNNSNDELTVETRAQLKELSKAMIRLHKILLDAAKEDYEAKNGKIANVNVYFRLVIDDAHFAWLRKISSLIALIDEAVSVRRTATETEALRLLKTARSLFNFEDEDEAFNQKFQTALLENADAVLSHNAVLRMLK
jgi:hypothetical protein